MKAQKVVITPEHVTLLKNLEIGWNDDAYEGAPEVDLKRPYGNSDVWMDIAEALDWPLSGKDSWGDPDLTEEQVSRAKALHREMANVLTVLVQNPTDFAPGTWENVSRAAPYGVLYRRRGDSA